MSPFEHIEQVKERYRHKLSGPQADLLSEDLARDEWPRKVKLATGCIHENLFNPELTISWMKEQCHINGHNFAGIFRKYMLQSPKEHIIKHRLAVAKQLLTDDALTDVHIIDIALSIGFSTHAAFNMEFKKYEGSTSGEFRRAHRHA